MKSQDKPILTAVQFHDEVANRWSSGYRRRSFRQRLALFDVIFSRHVQADDAWLDLGCGSGVLTLQLLERGASVTAVDGSAEMLRNLHYLVSEKGVRGVECIECDVQDVGVLSDATFDGVVCSSVIEYVEDPDQVLFESHRVLRVGGALIISIPAKASATRLIQKFIKGVCGVFGVSAFSYLSFSSFEVDVMMVRTWLEQKGFKVSRVTAFDPFLPRISLSVLRPSLLVIEARKR
ncbi:class I SAM-dependent methyltransferase [Methylolobus aquaticus]